MARSERVAVDVVPLAGVLAVALFLVGSLLPGSMPRPDAPTSSVIAFLTHHRSAILLGNVLILLSVPFFGIFLGSLVAAIRRAEGPRAVLTTATAFGWVILIGLVAVGLLVQTAVTWRGASELDPKLIRFAADLTVLSLYGVSSTAAALSVGAPSIVVARTAVLPRWLAGLGVLAVVANLTELVGIAARSGIDAAGYGAGVGPLVWAAWVALAAVALARPKHAAT